jgi:DNA polymerase
VDIEQAIEREPGATFALEDLGWIDFETRSPVGIEAGAVRYATEADAIVLAYALGAGPVNTVKVSAFDGPLQWRHMPAEIHNWHSRLLRGEVKWAAWNAGFDRAVWNYATLGFPMLEPQHMIDPMVQAAASGLPSDLAMASKFCGGPAKVKGGHDLMKLFCYPGATATPETHPSEWQQFTDVYATGDIAAMRSVFLRTRQLPLAEWREYWAMEAINDRGVAIDIRLAKHASYLAMIDRKASNDKIAELTGRHVLTVDQIARLTEWLLARLPVEGREILTKREEEINEEGELVKPAKFALTRARVERLIAFCGDKAELAEVKRLLQIRLYGGAKTPMKFAKMLQQHCDGMLYGQYVFNGAGQTGRASSRGVQVHNLARDALPAEPELIDAMLDGCKYGTLDAIGGDTPVARKLSLLIRPTFVPRGDNVFVWSDWSQIEARILPWLCDHYPGARKRLQIFRDCDADPKLPDLYTRSAADVSHLTIEQVTKAIRQRGKVAELALGYCGGVGALQAMAAGYGLHLTDAEAREIVARWRAANPWALDFAREIWEAMRLAMNQPHTEAKAGRVTFVYLPGYFNGSLLCQLPSGRWLTYRSMRWDRVDVLDEDDKPTGEKKLELMCARNYGRIKLWPGLFVENVTQATAADFLRGTLFRLEDNEASDWMPVRLHTHDEIVCETAVGDVDAAVHELHWAMQDGFDWSAGLPLMSEETIGYCYTKHEGSHGL